MACVHKREVTKGRQVLITSETPVGADGLATERVRRTAVPICPFGRQDAGLTRHFLNQGGGTPPRTERLCRRRTINRDLGAAQVGAVRRRKEYDRLRDLLRATESACWDGSLEALKQFRRILIGHRRFA